MTIGTFLKNGGNRYFCVTAMTATSITFEEYNGNGATGKHSTMGLTVFNALYKNKNFIVVRYVYSLSKSRWIEKGDRVAESIIGANRFLVKQGVPNR